MTAHSVPVVETLIHSFGDWLKHRREMNELRELNTSEFDRIASELRVSPGDLNELVRQGPHAADELPQMLQALGIDEAALTRTQRWCCATWNGSARCVTTRVSASATSPRHRRRTLRGILPQRTPRSTCSGRSCTNEDTALHLDSRVARRRHCHRGTVPDPHAQCGRRAFLAESSGQAALAMSPSPRSRRRSQWCCRAMSACNRSTICPSSEIAPREAFSGSSNAAMILRACATSSAAA